jgi:hypothetical protein
MLKIVKSHKKYFQKLSLVWKIKFHVGKGILMEGLNIRISNFLVIFEKIMPN